MQGSGRGLIWGGRSFCQSFSTWSARCEDKDCPVDVYFWYWLCGTTVVVIKLMFTFGTGYMEQQWL